ncbi:MAG TPA: hypothetical protein VKT99_23820, partial [Xanthobacteraceae bacterium]|nr:hypothetical protein [Xanthobacteraceae bacterium]
DREIEDTHIGNSRCAPATKSIQAIKAASDRGLAAFHVLPHSKFKRAETRADFDRVESPSRVRGRACPGDDEY